MATEFSGTVNVDLDSNQRQFLQMALHLALRDELYKLTGKIYTADQIEVNPAVTSA